MTDRSESPLSRLRGGVLPVLDERAERERRERIGRRVLEVGRELDQRRARRLRSSFGVALAACLASAAAVLLYQGSPAPSPVPATRGAEVRLVEGQVFLQDGASLAPVAPGALELQNGALLVTQVGQSAELRLASDTALSVAPASRLGIARQGPPDGLDERVRLRAGSVLLRVPKLGAKRTLSVETRDALIEVHGTQFSVRLVEEPPLEPFTEVKVLEGRVLVRSAATQRLLRAGDAWSSRPAPESAAVVAPSAAPAPEVEPPAPAPPRRARERATAASELAAQNRLLEASELAQKSGMPQLALERLGALIARYPDAELAHNARVERFRVLAAMGQPEQAARAARDYLERHPRGFARGEAERLIESAARPAAPGEAR